LSFGGKQTGVIYGALKELAHLNEKFKPDCISVTWDMQKSYRKEKYPYYKANRKPIPGLEDCKEQMHKLEKILPMIGVNSVVAEGYEGDDIMAVVAKEYKDVVICTGDHDMYQCLDKDVSIYNWKNTIEYIDFYKEYGFKPELWLMYSAFVGGHDNIKGVAGIGPKKALAILETCDYKEHKILGVLGKKQKREFKEAMELISLPWEGPGDLSKLEFELLEYEPDRDAIIEILMEYNIKALTSKDFRRLS
jgi:5'-3' exonuclease